MLAKKGRDSDWSQCAIEGVAVLSAQRHARKIQRGALRGNAFVIRLREIVGDRDVAVARIAAIATQGVPNYFGEQRFGRGGGNVDKALAMFAGQRVERAERSILLSAARSEIFNAVLAARVVDGSWQCALEGDVFQLDGRSAIFGPEPIGDELRDRVARGDIHPTGPMFGRGELRSTDVVRALESAVFDAHPELCAGFTVLASNPQETMKVLGGDWSRAKGGFRGYPLSWIKTDGLRGVGKLGTNAPRRPNEIHVDLSGGLVSALTLDQIRVRFSSGSMHSKGTSTELTVRSMIEPRPSPSRRFERPSLPANV